MTRLLNNWGMGDLPAPWAEDDVVRRVNDTADDRLAGVGLHGDLVVCYATSIGEGDEWYFRVTDGRRTSGRLHVGYVGRRTGRWAEVGDVDLMAAFELVHTDDPDGLALRDEMLAAGWALPVRNLCDSCGQEVRQ